jgi:ubiquinone/menaquinone biosynthesis C-methylase UbiE
MRLLDLGAGTGMWAVAFTDWCGIEVVAVEPSQAIRAQSYPGMVAGDASAIPLKAASVDGAWLSTVIHHIPTFGRPPRSWARATPRRRGAHPLGVSRPT